MVIYYHAPLNLKCIARQSPLLAINFALSEMPRQVNYNFALSETPRQVKGEKQEREVELGEGTAVVPPRRAELSRPATRQPDWTISSLVEPINSTLDEAALVYSPPTPPALPPLSTARPAPNPARVRVEAVVEPAPADSSTEPTEDFCSAISNMHEQIVASRVKRGEQKFV